MRIGGAETLRSIGEAVPFDGDGALVAADLLTTFGGTEKRAEYVATSRRYGVASPSLSFLVLEAPQDYLTADIAPPANYPSDALSLYLESRKRVDGERADEKRLRLERVTRDWTEQVAWWKRRFDPIAEAAAKKQAARIARSNNPPAVVMYATAAPPPPPPPAPEPGGAAPVGTDIVVTSSRVQPSAPAVSIEAWQPDREYPRAFDAAPARFDERFAKAEPEAGGVPAVYLDSAEWLRRHGRTTDAMQVVLSALELPAVNATTLGIVADRLERYGAIDRAIELRERQAALDWLR